MSDQEHSIEDRAREHRNYREECRRRIRPSIILTVLTMLALALWGIFFPLNLKIAGAIFALVALSSTEEIIGFRYHTRKLQELGDEED